MTDDSKPIGQTTLVGMTNETNFSSENKLLYMSDGTPYAPTAPKEPEGRKPVVILDPDRLKPIEKEIFNEHGPISCVKCAKPEARWAFLATETAPDANPDPVCSYCFLYESGWGLNRFDQITEMSKDVEQAMGTTFDRDPNGRMTSARDCDRILGAIAYISRMYMLRNLQMIKERAKVAPENSRIIRPSGGEGLIVSPMASQFKIKP